MDHAKYFILNNLSIESELRKVQSNLNLSLGPSHSSRREESQKDFYPQFSQSVRNDAEEMAENYKLFFSLENTIRIMIDDVLSFKISHDWWDNEGVVPEVVKKNAEANRIKEMQTGTTQRSHLMLDYTNFGELGIIISSNWVHFDDILTDKRAVERILGNLNTLRAAIAHCTRLAEDEVLRLHLSLRDWFRQQA